jgi:glycosyltransferase involved in cell wall biosynthesis
MNDPDLSIIVATFNEEESIEACLRRLLEVFPAGAEILVVDGGFDDTKRIVLQIAEDHECVRYVRNNNDRGKGHAIRTGIQEARGRIQTQIDADLQFHPEEIPKLIQPIRDGEADVTLGSRFDKDAVRKPGAAPFFRTLGNFIVSRYASLVVRHSMGDVTAGMKAWTAEAIAKVDLQSDNYSYEVEIPIKALVRGFRVMDVPVTFEVRHGGESHVNVISVGLALLRDITLFRLGWK